jgi:hypothetical protein
VPKVLAPVDTVLISLVTLLLPTLSCVSLYAFLCLKIKGRTFSGTSVSLFRPKRYHNPVDHYLNTLYCTNLKCTYLELCTVYWNISNILSCTVYVGFVVGEVLLSQTLLRACSLFCDFMQRRLVVYYRNFGKTYRSHRQGSRVRDCLTLETLSLVPSDNDQRG